jgi:hypothetical protein
LSGIILHGAHQMHMAACVVNPRSVRAQRAASRVTFHARHRAWQVRRACAMPTGVLGAPPAHAGRSMCHHGVRGVSNKLHGASRTMVRRMRGVAAVRGVLAAGRARHGRYPCGWRKVGDFDPCFGGPPSATQVCAETARHVVRCAVTRRTKWYVCGVAGRKGPKTDVGQSCGKLGYGRPGGEVGARWTGAGGWRRVAGDAAWCGAGRGVVRGRRRGAEAGAAGRASWAVDVACGFKGRKFSKFFGR